MAAREIGRLAGALWLVLFGAVTAAPGFAAEGGPAAKVPRFASLRSDEVNLRVGPGRNYPIEWVLTKKGLPVEIIAQFEHWRKIREPQGSEGWVQERMLTAQRAAMITGATRDLHRAPDAASATLARVEPGVIASLLECRGEWCRISVGRVTGWVRRSDIFGVLPDETVR
ncbi:MAG TPA: SH3 domain-containing protein [Stellaceae bacterium]|nr:SH3 domain-containing protein [Stellaceae bacterium]